MNTRHKEGRHISTFYLTSPLGGVGGQSRSAGILLPGKSPGTPLAWVGRRLGFDEYGKFCLNRVSKSEPSKP